MLKFDEAATTLLFAPPEPATPTEQEASPRLPPNTENLIMSCAVMVSGRPLLVSFWSKEDDDDVLVRGLDSVTAWYRELILGVEDYAGLGFGPRSSLSAKESTALCHQVVQYLAIDNEDENMRLVRPAPTAPVAEPEVPVVPGPSSISICGARVDGKLLLLWIVAHGEGQLLVHGFDPQTSQRMGELVIGPEHWAPTGYGPLAPLDPAEVQGLCGQVYGMLILDEAGEALMLREAQAEEPETEALEPRPTMLMSCAARVGGRPLLVSFWNDTGSDEVLVRGLDTLNPWCREFTLTCEGA
jgi:hypothetical protein